MKRISAILISVIMIITIISLAGCGTNETSFTSSESENSTNTVENEETMQNTSKTANNSLPTAVITLETGESITLELYPDEAPNTVANFISLANKGFYDGTIFHRVIKGFMMQGGDPEGTGFGGPGYAIKGEFKSNGVDNNIPFERGTIGMGRSTAPDSAGSQFFICQESYDYGNGQYAAFGKVTDGIEVVDMVCNTQTDYSDRPLTDIVIHTVTVDTHGVEYGEPVTIPE